MSNDSTSPPPVQAGWRDISTAPRDCYFLAPNRDGDLIRVCRFDQWAGRGDLVIDDRTQRIWSVSHWLPMFAPFVGRDAE